MYADNRWVAQCVLVKPARCNRRTAYLDGESAIRTRIVLRWVGEDYVIAR